MTNKPDETPKPQPKRTDKEQLALFDMYTDTVEYTPPDVWEASRQYMLYLEGKPSTYRPTKRKEGNSKCE